jgi:hypothetical protein
MAVTEQRQLFAPQIESLAEQYAKSMGTQAAKPFTAADITAMAPQVAPQTQLQQRATTDTTAGLGAYQPYVTRAGQAGTAAGTALTAAGQQLGTAQTGLGAIGQTYADPAVAGIQAAEGTLGQVSPYIADAKTGLAGAGTTLGTAGTQLGGAQTAMGGAQQYITDAAGLTGTGAGTGAGTIADYMSPYQQQVIDTSLAEFDKQAAMRQQGISDAAVAMGGYGGGREGVMQSEYMAQSDRDRAMLQAQLQQQGYSQAQAARQADLATRLGIGGAQQQYASGLAGIAGQRAGLAGQEAALAQGQLGLGAAQQSLAGAQLGAGQAYLAPGQLMAGVAGQQAGTAGQRAQLGQAQLGLGQFELGAGQAEQGMLGRDVGLAGQVGAMDQAYAQAVMDADREKARMGLYEPMERLGFLGQGLTGLMGGMGPQYQFQTQPNASPLATALGIGTAGAGIYRDVMQGMKGFST